MASKFLNISTDTTLGGNNPSDTIVASEKAIKTYVDNNSGSLRNIGEIVASTIPLTDAGLHLLDGSLLAYGSYQAFIDYIADLYDSGDYTDIFETEANWQSSVTTYGVCGKFVYNSTNNTVRLPKYNSKIYTGGGEASVVGNGVSIEYTNGSTNWRTSWQFAASGTSARFPGAVDGTGNVGANTGSEVSPSSGLVGLTTDPEKSGIIADLSDITTSLDGYYYIVVATSTKTDIEVDIDEIATDLNCKVDKSSLSEVYPVVETYVNGTSWYRVYSDNWCEQGGITTAVTNTNTTINLLKTYTNTNYELLVSSISTNTDAHGIVTITSKTIASATVQCFDHNNGNRAISASWQASGYIS